MARARLSDALLAFSALAFTAAFFVVPRPAAATLSGRSYGDEQHLIDHVSSAFVEYWRIGRRELTPELSRLVEYWRVYLSVKAVAAIGLLIVLTVLANRLWKAFTRTDAHARARAAATAGVTSTVLAVSAFVVALADVQGAIAPFSSLMSMLPVNSARGDLAVMVEQVQHDLAHYPSGSSGALTMMVGDLAVYHVVVAVISWSTAVVLAVLMVVWWRRGARTMRVDRRTGRLFRSFAMGSGFLIVLMAVLGLANTTVAADSPTAVSNFYQGSF